MGEGLNKPLSCQRCLQTLFIFLYLTPRSFLRARRCFWKERKENKTTKERLFLYFSFSRARRCFLKERKEKWNNVCLQATLSNRLVTLTSPLTHVKDEAKGVVTVTILLTLVKDEVKYEHYTFTLSNCVKADSKYAKNGRSRSACDYCWRVERIFDAFDFHKMHCNVSQWTVTHS